MDWLNYHHLLYFWTVAREGSVTAASRRLQLAQPTVSAQIKTLESSLGHDLFDRSGRRLVLTDFGRMVAQYADEIFTTGQELMWAVAQEPTERPLRVVVGLADVVPKLVAHAILEPVMAMQNPSAHLVVREAKSDRLLADLAVYDVDLVLSDTPIRSGASVRAFNHLLGECATGLFASPKLARKYRREFPASLASAPMLLPTANTTLRTGFDAWAEDADLSPPVVAEFEDSALLKVFGQRGHGLFPAPMVIASMVEKKYGVRLVGVLDDVVERFYVISLERRVTHPAVKTICDESRHDLFAASA